MTQVDITWISNKYFILLFFCLIIHTIGSLYNMHHESIKILYCMYLSHLVNWTEFSSLSVSLGLKCIVSVFFFLYFYFYFWKHYDKIIARYSNELSMVIKIWISVGLLFFVYILQGFGSGSRMFSWGGYENVFFSELEVEMFSDFTCRHTWWTIEAAALKIRNAWNDPYVRTQKNISSILCPLKK